MTKVNHFWFQQDKGKTIINFMINGTWFYITGDRIEVLTRTDTQNDWWEGRLKGKVGIFPANYVQIKS